MASDFIKRLPSRVLAMYGHVREALRMTPVGEDVIVFAGALGILADDSVRAAMARSSGPPWGYMGWLAARRDTVALSALASVADSVAGLPGQGTDRSRRATFNLQTARAALALARRDTTAALAALDAVPDTLRAAEMLRFPLTRAQLLVARGRVQEASKVLDEAQDVDVTSPVLVLIELERARSAERLGEMPRALEGYRYLVGMWRHADPELQPFVTEAREALVRLTGEPRPVNSDD